MIHVRFFASVREKLGQAGVNLEYAGEDTIADVMKRLEERGENWQLLREKNLLCALNQSICAKDTKVNDGDEVAFFPPVTGG